MRFAERLLIENNILFFDAIRVCDKEILKNMKGKKGTNTIGFAYQNIKMINDVLLYYACMYKNDNDALSEKPDQWVIADFKKLRSRGCPKNATTYTVSQAGNTTNTTSTTSNVTAPVSQTKLEEDAYLSWRRGKQDPTCIQS